MEAVMGGLFLLGERQMARTWALNPPGLTLSCRMSIFHNS